MFIVKICENSIVVIPLEPLLDSFEVPKSYDLNQLKNFKEQD
jgi:hypothetical protein